MAKTNAKPNSILLIVTATVSVLWVGACVGLLLAAKPCGVASDIVASHITCLEANQIGDFLAGAFAPLAFLWLIAAVLLQRDELAAQREELRQSREVAEQQVEEARRNVAFVAQQTDVLKQQHKMEVERLADLDVDRQIQICNLAFDRINGELGATHVFDKDVIQLAGDDEPDEVRRLTLRLRGWNDFADGAQEMNGDNGPIEFKNDALIEAIRRELLNLVRASEKASTGKRLQVATIGAEKGIASAELLYGLNKWGPEDFLDVADEENAVK